MRIVQATWEKRNLGVEAMEFDVALSDGADVVADILKNEKQYNVVKIPAGNTESLEAVQKSGYTFIENMISIAITVNEFMTISFARPQQRMVDALNYSPMIKKDMATLFDELKSGIFANDRISRDSHFGQSLAAQRYIGFSTDTIANGGEAFNIVYKEQNIGFFINKMRDSRECYGSLFGMYPSWKKSGLGIGGAYLSLKQAFENSAKIFTGNISSNNLDQFRLGLSLGLKVTGIIYILTKHN